MLSKIMKVFENSANSAQGKTNFFEVEEGSEWGVDVINLDRIESETSSIAYRLSNPMVDENWKCGSVEDLPEAIDEQAYMWNEFKNG